MSETPLIHRAMIAVMKDVSKVAKNDKNDFHKFMFRGIDATLNALGPAMRKHGVFILPEVKSKEFGEVHTKNGKATLSRVTVRYNFVAEDGSSVHTVSIGEAMDSGDKSVSKAMSVALRTCLLQTFVLPTDEPDPDHDSYEQIAPPPISAAQGKYIGELFGQLDMGGAENADARAAYISKAIGRTATAADMTADEGRKITEALEGDRNRRAQEDNINQSLGGNQEEK